MNSWFGFRLFLSRVPKPLKPNKHIKKEIEKSETQNITRILFKGRDK
jgi:hypothetical protein